jgi:hypothetical protein
LFAIFGAIAYKRAPYAFARSNLKYTQSGQFAYSARTSPGPVYPGGRVVTGQPLFTKLVHKVTVSFDYLLRSSFTHEVTGTQSLRVELLDPNGYSRLVQKVPPLQLSGDTGSVRATIDIDRLDSLANKLERATGVPRSSDIVAVTPVTKVSGTLDGQQFSTSYSPSLNFQIDALEMRLVASSPTPDSTAPELAPSQASALPVLTKQQSHVDIAFIHMHVRTARFVAVAGAGLCLLLLLFVGIPLWRALNGDEATRIEVKHGALLVPLRSSWFTSSKTKVDVASIDSLVQIAYGYEKLILHAQDGGVHRYVVESDGVLFTYETRGRR